MDGFRQDIDLIPHLVPPTSTTDAGATLNTHETGLATTNEQSDGIAGSVTFRLGRQRMGHARKTDI
jgi:hypothetical protein